MARGTEIGRLLVWRAGWLKNQGLRTTRETSAREVARHRPLGPGRARRDPDPRRERLQQRVPGRALPAQCEGRGHLRGDEPAPHAHPGRLRPRLPRGPAAPLRAVAGPGLGARHRSAVSEPSSDRPGNGSGAAEARAVADPVGLARRRARDPGDAGRGVRPGRRAAPSRARGGRARTGARPGPGAPAPSRPPAARVSGRPTCSSPAARPASATSTRGPRARTSSAGDDPGSRCGGRPTRRSAGCSASSPTRSPTTPGHPNPNLAAIGYVAEDPGLTAEPTTVRPTRPPGR